MKLKLEYVPHEVDFNSFVQFESLGDKRMKG